MSIELQIQSSTLGAVASRAVQARLWTHCFQPVGAIYIDHADVAAPVQLIARGATVQIRVPVDVFVVDRKDVLAAPDTVPSGATMPATRVVVVLEMAVNGTVVKLECLDAEGAGSAKVGIIEALGPGVLLDLTVVMKQLGVPAPETSRIELIGSIVAIRFEPADSGSGHLYPGQEWGMFLDGESVEQLARSKVPNDLMAFPGMAINAHWRPVGDKPHVDVDYAAKLRLGALSADIGGVIACDFSLKPPPVPALRETVHWSLDINLGAVVPDFFGDFAEDLFKDRINGLMNPKTFGGTPIGYRAFSIDNPLSNVSFGGAHFGYASVVASPLGMTIGGPVLLPHDLGKNTLLASVNKFGLPSRLTTCRNLAKSGSIEPSQTVSLSEVKTYARVLLEGYGKLCEVEIVSPGKWIEPFIKPSGDTAEIMIVIPSTLALAIVDAVRLIVRTTRGVRLVDLGIPPPVELNAKGDVLNARIIHTRDCLFINVEHGIKWARAGGLLDQSVVNPPLEHPDWITCLGRHRGIDVQLVTLTALDPGELIQFRSRNHTVDITADRNGRALVPVMLPVANDSEEASLIRVNRRGIAGHFTVRTAIFVEQANLPAGTQQQLASSIDGAAVLTTRFKNHIDVHEIGPLGVPVLVKREKTPTHGSEPSHEETALNPQPLPPHGVPHNPLLGRRINIPGLKSLVAVPGFAEAPIAFATMVDGSTLVLDFAEDGTPHVAGTLTGPIGVLDISGDWAVAADLNRISIFHVIRG